MSDKYTKVFVIRLAVFLAYLFGGSAIFMVIERGENSGNTTAIIMQELKKNMTKLYNVTEQEFNFLVEKVVEITSRKPQKAWSYIDCYVYGLHLLTTIGYGNITPATKLGQIVTIIYGLFGIPLTLLAMRAMAFHFNVQMSNILIAVEIKCLKRNQVKDKELKIVFFNVFLTLLYLFLSALTSTSVDNYNYTQAVYVWFITMTTVGFGDFVPRETINNPHNILIGLCFMSGTIDSMVTYYESKSESSSLGHTVKNCLCCRSEGLSSGTETVNIYQTELSGKKHVATQTQEMMTFGVHNPGF